jgi:pimeloyl-ACP methyl ester carboxylesterase
VPTITLPESPLAPGRGPARIHFRDHGRGPALLILHGGWGQLAYPFDRQVEALGDRFRVLLPDRTGYGASGRLEELPPGFHRAAAEETLRFMDALGIGPAALWGHSDGAVIAAWAAVLRPDRVRAVILEALHYFEAKEHSVEFFRTGAESPERFGEDLARTLARDHGQGWREVVAMGARAWLRIIEHGRRGGRDLFAGRLQEVRAPCLLLHGTRDPRSEPGEVEAARRDLPRSEVHLLDAGHSPHTSERTRDACTRLAVEFLDRQGRS